MVLECAAPPTEANRQLKGPGSERGAKEEGGGGGERKSNEQQLAEETPPFPHSLPCHPVGHSSDISSFFSSSPLLERKGRVG